VARGRGRGGADVLCDVMCCVMWKRCGGNEEGVGLLERGVEGLLAHGDERRDSRGGGRLRRRCASRRGRGTTDRSLSVERTRRQWIGAHLLLLLLVLLMRT